MRAGEGGKVSKELNDRLTKTLNELTDDLDNAAWNAWQALHAVRASGKTGRRCLYMLKACEKLKDRAYELKAALAKGD